MKTSMNNHLKLVREFHSAFAFPQAEHGENKSLPEMTIIFRQALLMEEGGELFRAIKSGDMVKVLAGMINLSCGALGAIAIQGADVLEQPVTWRHDGFVISLILFTILSAPLVAKSVSEYKPVVMPIKSMPASADAI